MPTYAYKALDRQGKQTAGLLPADSRVGAFDQLSARGLSPISVDEQNGAGASAGSRIGRLFGSAGAPDANGGHASAAAKNLTPPASTKVSAASLESFTREMANLLAAGLPLSRALALLKREASQLQVK